MTIFSFSSADLSLGRFGDIVLPGSLGIEELPGSSTTFALRSQRDSDCWGTPTSLARAEAEMPLGQAIFRIMLDLNPSEYVIIAVSYTHLRAHETDSYLVCR